MSLDNLDDFSLSESEDIVGDISSIRTPPHSGLFGDIPLSEPFTGGKPYLRLLDTISHSLAEPSFRDHYPDQYERFKLYRSAKCEGIVKWSLRLIFGQARSATAFCVHATVKTYLCQLIEEAMVIQKQSGETLPLSPSNVQLAYARLCAQKKGPIPIRKRRLFWR
ncbi:hypothetical protein GEMRC1_012279 [Eukaryota sp. GEM-RC1]